MSSDRGGSGSPHRSGSQGLPLLQSQVSVVPFRRTHDQESHFAAPEAAELPVRYETREREDGVVLRCKEAPGVAAHIDRSFSFSEPEARKLGERVILLDGAGQFAPLLDDSQHLYNLDHHVGCLRAFTLATCEQALLMVLKGLDLDKGDWTLYANEPDLDTVLALWVLLNHRRVRSLNPRTREILVPLLRLEGAIDANGYELAEYCGLPHAAYQASRARLDSLFAREQVAKQDGQWNQLDPVLYTKEMLAEVDKLVYERGDFSDFASVEEELGHVEIGPDRVAVICRDGAGIYEVEKRLKKVWGERLGVIALAKGQNHYTLRRTASFAGIDLQDAYDRLNLLDREVDGHPPEKRWGGSDEIGGSPRPQGTSLTPGEIGKILRLAYRKRRPAQVAKNLLMVLLWSVGLAVAGLLAVLMLRTFVARPETVATGAQDLGLFALVMLLGAFLLTRDLARSRAYIFGWRRPAGRDWLALLPLALLGGAAGGAWIPAQAPQAAGWGWGWVLGALLLSAFALEAWFRGVVHGRLMLDCRVQGLGGPWFLSMATLASAVLAALVGMSVAPVLLTTALEPLLPWGRAGTVALGGGGALLASLALGMIRERSLSLLPGVLAQLLGAGLALAVAFWLGSA